MSKSDYSKCTAVPRVVGGCGGVSVDPCGIFEMRQGSSSPPPHTAELPFKRQGNALLPGLVLDTSTRVESALVSCFGAPTYVLNVDPNETLRLVNQLKNNITGHSFQPGVSLGEANETIGMMGSASKKLASNLDKLLKSKHHTLIPHSLWLEAVYGWAPLFSDLKSGAEFFASAFNKPRKVTYRAKVRTLGSPQSSSPVVQVAGKVERVVYVTAHVTEKGNLAYTGLIDPMSVAWELIPYSFVVDWFNPIGSYLAARAFLGDLEAHGCVSTKFSWNITTTGVSHPRFRMLLPCLYKGHTFERVVGLPSLPLPKFKPLSHVLPNWRHWVDGAALAANYLGGIKIKV